jgi:TATA-box binding protein (TBP) (component of TFIID and TFIIIB)
MTKFRIVNVVATASLDQELDFGKLRKFKEISHDPKVYVAVWLTSRKHRCKDVYRCFVQGK